MKHNEFIKCRKFRRRREKAINVAVAAVAKAKIVTIAILKVSTNFFVVDAVVAAVAAAFFDGFDKIQFLSASRIEC